MNAPASVTVIGHGIPTLLLVAALTADQHAVRWVADDPTYGRPTHDWPILLTNLIWDRPFAPPRMDNGAALDRFIAWMSRAMPQAEPPQCYHAHMTTPTRSERTLAPGVGVLSALDLWRRCQPLIDAAAAAHANARRKRLRITVLPTPPLPIRLTPQPPPQDVDVQWIDDALIWTFPWRQQRCSTIHPMRADLPDETLRGGVPLPTATDSWRFSMRTGSDITLWLRDMSAIVHAPAIAAAMHAILAVRS